ncbi:MAG: SDR family oxidoreductase [SAR202 cluster bacterium]|nr:3-oxoacyl-ACP reductase [Chloroflexota bacterium]MQG88535.1 SDR family oxidoreductase [SAR202 cluster bacterium]|tara:strand:+ start:464 stop:1264 length:801 start_codon:yes stop_codon:yes gene_type:complete
MTSIKPTRRLEGKVAIITGGGGAIGSAQAQIFAREGAAICVADNRIQSAKKVASEIISLGGRAIAVELDVRESSAWRQVVSKTERELGPITILCNNAGANFRVEFEQQTDDQFELIMDVGLNGAFFGIKAVVPSMRRAGAGVILNMGSLAAIRPGGGSPGYAAQKMAMVGLTRSAAQSFAKDNIRCVIISPGHVDTPFIRGNNEHSPNSWETTIDNPENFNRRLVNTPLGRLQSPEDIANAFMFAATDDAAMITGSMITVDGGAGM